MPLQIKDRTLASPSPPSPEPGTVLLETERLIIRRLLPSDAPAMAFAANHTVVFNNLRDRMPSPYTLADAESWIASLASQETTYPSHPGIFLKPAAAAAAAAASSSDGVGTGQGQGLDQPVLIGSLGIMPKGDVEYRTWELGYWLTPSAWGKGYATEAAGAFVHWIFATWPRLNRIEAEVLTRNEGSAGVLAKCGFTREGVRRGCVEKCGVVTDHIMFGLLRSDLGSV
ncbi:putative N-acetyltransferase [Escovopsis weberi]|uniref:Putative N-acetyltransferase n=1 Tax=Escovopsis weberi TaxID=150374 RepID=A0A0M8MZW2_ESCWE|nr:putative N-acetyltransferase [Escovopsis weberi]